MSAIFKAITAIINRKPDKKAKQNKKEAAAEEIKEPETKEAEI